jgi:bacteriorhodopsin
MVLDLYRLTEHATRGATSWIDQYRAAALMPVMVFFGVVYRFYANEFRGKEKNSVDSFQVLIGVMGFVWSCVVFGLVVSGILNPIEAELCGPGINATSDGTCPITDPELKYDRDAVRVLTYVWIGYPIVSVLSRAMIKTYGKPSEAGNCLTYAQHSLFKDVSYAVLDVVSKGGLALYVCYRTTWV